MPKRLRTEITEANTPPRHRILEVLDKHKGSMSDQAYKEIVESIASEIEDSKMYKITFVERYELEKDGPETRFGQLPQRKYADPVMKEVEMTLEDFLFSICDLDESDSQYHAAKLVGKEWLFPRGYVADLCKTYTWGDAIATRKHVTLLSACKM